MNYILPRRIRRILAAIEIAEAAIHDAFNQTPLGKNEATLKKYDLGGTEDVAKIMDEGHKISNLLFIRRAKIGKQ